MKYTIKNRLTCVVIFEKEAESLAEALKGDANLREANLHGADLCGARIKATQKEDLLKALRIEIEE